MRESLLRSKCVSVKSLQKFAGKVASFSLAVPAAGLFCRQVNASISKGIKSSRPIKMWQGLEEELKYWRFLDSWNGYLSWKEEKHFVVQIVLDASNFGWERGGILHFPDGPKKTRDYWFADEEFPVQDTAIKEARALFKSLLIFADEIYSGRVKAAVDNTNLINLWENGGRRSLALSEDMKDLFFLTLKLNISLSLSFVPSESNLADEPSRIYSDSDCSLSPCIWSLVNSTFGPHTHDMMTIPSNVMKDSSGQSLTFFSPHPVPGTSGVDVFAQSISPLENYYIFPPFVFIGPLLRFFSSQKLRVTLIVPDISPRKYWWPVLKSFCIDRLRLGKKGQGDVLFFPPQSNKIGLQGPFFGIFMLTELFFNFFQLLPQMEVQVTRLWKPVVCCASCRYPNDFDFKFCQKCGFLRQPLEPFAPPPLVDVDGDRVSERLSALKVSRDAKPYQRQKSSLQRQIESYLWSLPGKQSLNSTFPNDVISFLVWRDKFGKTVSHLSGCSGKVLRNCPRKRAAGTIDNNIGKLRTIFKEAGRGSFWNDDLQLGSPASHSSVKNYYTMVLEEQAISRIFPKQAVPMFLDK